ncbi:MAG: hypothetical protein IJO56_05845 [Oscillospiraceae bacterium]|nr:hypothetical protein [Oscillospiraceae bacterium]
MPRQCKIIIHYLDGKTEEYFGGLHKDDTILHIYPADRRCQTVRIPLANIRCYVTEG